MDKGRFLFIIIVAVCFAIAVVTLFLRNTKLCYDNICDMRLDYF